MSRGISRPEENFWPLANERAWNRPVYLSAGLRHGCELFTSNYRRMMIDLRVDDGYELRDLELTGSTFPTGSQKLDFLELVLLHIVTGIEWVHFCIHSVGILLFRVRSLAPCSIKGTFSPLLVVVASCWPSKPYSILIVQSISEKLVLGLFYLNWLLHG